LIPVTPLTHLVADAEAICNFGHTTVTRHAFTVSGRSYARCNACGLYFRYPRFKVVPYVERYRKEYYKTNPQRYDLLVREEPFRAALDQLERFLPQRGRILDVGCGPGGFLELCARRGWQVQGLDLSEIAATIASFRLGIEVFCGMLEETHYPDRAFDAATLLNVLDSTPSPSATIEEICRILRPGGVLLIRSPNAAVHRFLEPLLRPFGLVDRLLVFHPYCFTADCLQTVLAEKGCEVLAVRNAALSYGDPDGVLPLGDKVMNVIKRSIYAVAQGVYHMTAGRLLISPNMEVLVRRPFLPGTDGG